jgi:hypothetical protein
MPEIPSGMELKGTGLNADSLDGRPAIYVVQEDAKWLPTYARPATVDEVATVQNIANQLPAELRQWAMKGQLSECAIGIVGKEHKSSSFGAQILFSVYDMMHQEEITRNIWYQLIHTAINPNIIAANGGADAMYNQILDEGITMPKTISKVISAFNNDVYEGIDDLLALLGLTYKDGISIEEQAHVLNDTLAPDNQEDNIADRWDMEDAVKMVILWRQWIGITVDEPVEVEEVETTSDTLADLKNHDHSWVYAKNTGGCSSTTNSSTGYGTSGNTHHTANVDNITITVPLSSGCKCDACEKGAEKKQSKKKAKKPN